jgi:DNA uptake protein ComE-like DNA-binding protein
MKLTTVFAIATLVIFAGANFASAQPTVPGTTAAKPTAAVARPAGSKAAVSAVAAPTLLDINSASKSELDALPGIGVARAHAIINARPYKGKDELVQKKIISQGVYDGIKDKIIAKQKS